MLYFIQSKFCDIPVVPFAILVTKYTVLKKKIQFKTAFMILTLVEYRNNPCNPELLKYKLTEEDFELITFNFNKFDTFIMNSFCSY